MTPDDPRHGTNAGYVGGCRDECCRTAHADYRRGMRSKRYLRGVERLYIDATGTARRIRALQALGWRFVDIDKALGRNPTGANACWSHNVISQERVHVDTAAAVAEVYERLCMTLGPSAKTRSLAAGKGWLPPLAWDNIDDPNERPARMFRPNRRKSEVDHAVIERVLAGERLHTTAAEKRIIVARWAAQGRSHKSLCDRMGWQDGRYKDELGVAS